MKVCISPGTTIGAGAIVGMGSVVSGNVPALAILGNQKLRIFGYRNKSKYHELDKMGKYGGPDGVPFELPQDFNKEKCL